MFLSLFMKSTLQAFAQIARPTSLPLYQTIQHHTGDIGLLSKAESKAGKYHGHANELKRLYSLKSIKMHAVIKEAYGAILKGTKNICKELFYKQGTNAMKLCQ